MDLALVHLALIRYAIHSWCPYYRRDVDSFEYAREERHKWSKYFFEEI